MELFDVYATLIGLISLLYVVPFFLIRRKDRFYLSLIIGTCLFYVLGAFFVYFTELYSWDDGTHPFCDAIAMALFISMPFVLLGGLVVGCGYYFINRFQTRKK